MSEISKDKMKNVTYICCVALEDTAMDVDRRRIRSINGTAAVLWNFPRESCHVRAAEMEEISKEKSMGSCGT